MEKQIYLIGTIHVSEESRKRVEEAILGHLPVVVCVELDFERFKTLQKMMREGGHFPYSLGGQPTPLLGLGGLISLEGLLRWLQQKIGEEFGVMPGIEMAAAIETAQKQGLNIALIDRPIRETIFRLQRFMSFKEKVRLIGYLGLATSAILLKPLGSYRFLSLFSNEKKLDLRALEKGEGVDDLLDQLKREFPTIYNVLVAERNSFMAGAIVKLLQTHDRVLVVVGLGHVSGIKELLEKRGVSANVID